MRIAVRCSPSQKEEWLSKQGHIEICSFFGETDIDLFVAEEADIYFDLLYKKNFLSFYSPGKLFFVNSVVETLNKLPPNCFRINGWNSFIEREVVELVIRDEHKNTITNVMQALQWKFALVPDIAGMVAARCISMIINEAYFALGEEISTKREIDIAMKSGTNYPFGPFEWSERIGLNNIHGLLEALAAGDQRYEIAPLLKNEVARSL